MIYFILLFSKVLGLITRSEVEENWSSEIWSDVEHFCGVDDVDLIENLDDEENLPEEGRARAGDWVIDDFDDSIGRREGDGLQ